MLPAAVGIALSPIPIIGVVLVLGLTFLALAVRKWRGRPAAGAEHEMPEWMGRVDGFGPGKTFVLAIVLSALNPKNFALAVAGAASIVEAGLPDDEEDGPGAWDDDG